MNAMKKTPTFLFLLIAYNILMFIPAGPEGGALVDATLFEFALISGAVCRLDVNTLFIIIGLHALYFEILKSTWSGASTIINHALSLIVFIIFLVQFIVMKQAGTASFLILTFMSLLVVIAGFTVTISAARRDIVMNK